MQAGEVSTFAVRLRTGTAAMALALLSGCGGGGGAASTPPPVGSGSTPAPTPTPTPTPSPNALRLRLRPNADTDANANTCAHADTDRLVRHFRIPPLDRPFAPQRHPRLASGCHRPGRNHRHRRFRHRSGQSRIRRADFVRLGRRRRLARGHRGKRSWHQCRADRRRRAQRHGHHGHRLGSDDPGAARPIRRALARPSSLPIRTPAAGSPIPRSPPGSTGPCRTARK